MKESCGGMEIILGHGRQEIEQASVRSLPVVRGASYTGIEAARIRGACCRIDLM